MFYLRTAILNIRRYKYKSILSALICTLVVLLLNLYMANMQAGQKQLNDLAAALPVSAHVSNADGSQDVGLEIREEIIKQLQASQYVSKLRYTVQFIASLGAFPEGEWQKYLNIPVTGVNTIEALPALPQENISLADGTKLDFLQSNEAQCLADEQFLHQNGLAVGDSIELSLYYYRYEMDRLELFQKPLGVYTFTIVGKVEQWSQMDFGVTVPQIILPIGWAREAFSRAGIEFYVDSAAFTVKDALKLNAFKDQMLELRFKTVSAKEPFSYSGNALKVDDGNFIKAASHLKENLSLLTSFLFFILVVVAFAGYITSYLLMQSRRPEFAVMRSLGSSRKACFALLFMENLALQLLGGLLGTVTAMLLGMARITAIPALITVFFFMLGTMAALLMLNRFSIMAVLSRND